MRVMILLGGKGRRLRPLTWSRPKALLHVAGNTVLGHILHSLEKVLTDEVVFVVGDKGEQITEWVQVNYPELDSRFVSQDGQLTPAQAIHLCRALLLDNKDVLVVSGNSIVEADYNELADLADRASADAVVLVKEPSDAHGTRNIVMDKHGLVADMPDGQGAHGGNMTDVGISWFRNSRQLLDAVEQVGTEDESGREAHFLAGVHRAILATGGRIGTMEAHQWSDAGHPETLLQTNTRLLSIGLHSADAIERSYAEDFTVLPPVYLHPEASVVSAVIGPYTSIDAHAVISHAVISRSIVGAGSTVSNCILDRAIVGEQTRISGRGKALLVGDNSLIELD